MQSFGVNRSTRHDRLWRGLIDIFQTILIIRNYFLTCVSSMMFQAMDSLNHRQLLLFYTFCSSQPKKFEILECHCHPVEFKVILLVFRRARIYQDGSLKLLSALILQNFHQLGLYLGKGVESGRSNQYSNASRSQRVLKQLRDP